MNALTPQSKPLTPKPAYYALSFFALVIIFAVIWWAYLPIIVGVKILPNYANLSWAHDPSLLKNLLSMLVMLWLVSSAIFWGGWLFRRSIRKTKGLQWRINRAALGNSKNKNGVFFPPVLRYLKFSCYYLAATLFFVILQYPLQFLIF